MPKYRAYAVVSGGKYLGEFEADTPEAAKELAMESDAASVCLCHQCCDQCEDPEVVDVQIDPVE